MEENKNTPALTSEEEAKLNRIASRRSSFKMHLTIFLLANAFLWVVWYFLFKDKEDQTFLTAILFVLIVWLLGLIIHYLIAYKWTKNLKERELSSLKQQLQQQLAEVQSLKDELKEKNPEQNPENENKENVQ